MKLEPAAAAAAKRAALLEKVLERVALLLLLPALIRLHVLAAVVLAALLLVRQHLVRLGDRGEELLLLDALGLGQIADLVRVQLQRELLEGLRSTRTVAAPPRGLVSNMKLIEDTV